jgi:2-oxo-4-hydroxy-4-carboxy-5-ureidoimidazoline decarboxylase
MVSARPYESHLQLKEVADRSWMLCKREDALEAFSHHPKIGDVESLAKKFASTSQWAGNEQSGVNSASRMVLEDLASGNDAYERKFGYIFIVCATGKTADEMLAILQSRLPNDPDDELSVAMAEQHKITHLRIEKLLS